MTANVSKPRQIAYVDQVCNPNLIANWNFQNVINQRGQLEYKGIMGFIFDMWQSSGSAYAYLSYNDNVYKINKVEFDVSKHGFTHVFEEVFESGECYTLTLEVTDLIGTAYINFSGVKYNQQVHNGINIVSGIVGPGYNNDRPGTIYLWGEAGASYRPIGIKVERGTISTYKNEVFDYEEALRKCQRYYERIGLGINAKIGGANGKAYITVTHKFAVEKRVTPTIGLIKQPQFYTSNIGPILPNNTVIDGMSADTKAIQYLNLSGFINPLDPSMPYPCHSDTQDFLEVSAEL